MKKKQTKKEKKIEEEKEGLWRWDRFNVAVMINPTNIAEYMLRLKTIISQQIRLECLAL